MTLVLSEICTDCVELAQKPDKSCHGLLAKDEIHRPIQRKWLDFLMYNSELLLDQYCNNELTKFIISHSKILEYLRH